MEKDVIKIEREQLEALVTVGLKVVVNWSLISECNDEEVGDFLVEENIKRLAKAAGSVHDSMQELNDL